MLWKQFSMEHPQNNVHYQADFVTGHKSCSFGLRLCFGSVLGSKAKTPMSVNM